MFSARALTEDEADLIADAFFKAGRDPRKVALHLGVATFDLACLAHPVVRRKIIALAKEQSRKYSLDKHLEKLQEIRDLCMQDGNYKTALAAEVSVGKAAGLYDMNRKEESDKEVEPEKLTTDQIRDLLAKSGVRSAGVLPSPDEVQGEFNEVEAITFDPEFDEDNPSGMREDDLL